MITAKELRIGNLVNFEGDMISVTAGDIHYFDENLDSFDGIPLTPEILEKAGFEKGGAGLMRKSIQNSTYIEIDLEWEVTVLATLKGDILFVPYSQPLHLHQLQNLYFALTGEELPIEL